MKLVILQLTVSLTTQIRYKEKNMEQRVIYLKQCLLYTNMIRLKSTIVCFSTKRNEDRRMTMNKIFDCRAKFSLYHTQSEETSIDLKEILNKIVVKELEARGHNINKVELSVDEINNNLTWAVPNIDHNNNTDLEHGLCPKQRHFLSIQGCVAS